MESKLKLWRLRWRPRLHNDRKGDAVPSNDLAKVFIAVVMTILSIAGSRAVEVHRDDAKRKGYDITPTGLIPKYPAGYECSPLTSLYASWIDVDGSHRNERHSGVDAGRLNDWILAPAAGKVRAAWEADWGWGREGALLIVHTREDLGLSEGPAFYYSEFDHLDFREVKGFRVGQEIGRGDRLARVSRPGGKEKYLEEVHWEVWEVEKDADLEWHRNEQRAQFWTNTTARLVDPLYMLALNSKPDDDGSVTITPYLAGRNYNDFRGFTYILPCEAK